MRRVYGLLALLLAVAAALPVAATAQATGVITGRVVNQATQQPLAGAQVFVSGTTTGALTNQDGRYRMTGVRAGSYDLRVTIVGFAAGARRVQVAAGQTLTADFSLAPSALALEGLVVSATGLEQRQREIGSAVGNIQLSDVELAPVTNFSDLVQGRTAGVTVVQSSGTTGGGSRIRIRGSNSVSLSNSPLLVIDGVRVDADPQSYGLFSGGQTTSRLNDLNPEDIESIEILKGPAASALYGTAAANGVIQVTTKRGKAGRTQYRAWAEAGSVEQTTDFPSNYYALGTNGKRCDFLARAAGSCTAVDTVFVQNPLENPETTPFRDGSRQTYGASVSGGGEEATYYVSAEREQETGVQLANELSRTNLRANLNGNVNEKLSFGVNLGYLDSDIELPQNDNSSLGALLTGLTGRPTPAYADWQYFGLPRDYIFGWTNNQDLTRFTASATAEFHPFEWLTLNGNGGMDQVNRLDAGFVRPGLYDLFGEPFSIGFLERDRYNIHNYTGTLNATAVFDLREGLISTTSTGANYYRDRTNEVYAFGAGVTPGTGSLGGASTQFEATESNAETATLGAYLQQQLAWNDRVFANVAVRGDKNSAFGTDIGWVWYPSASLSWVLSEEPFFPESDLLSNLRLRAAYGKSGLRPRFRQAMQYFVGAPAAVEGGEAPGFVVSGPGNPELKPEISREIELGFEAGFLAERVGLEVTYYNKKSTDALINRPMLPSAGMAWSRLENLGEVKNSGMEFQINAKPLQGENLEWDVTFGGSTNDNELVALGADVQTIFFGLSSTQAHKVGFPLGAYFMNPIKGYADRNEDGLLSGDEVVVGDTAEFLGRPFPKREFSFSTNLSFRKWLRVSGLMDYKGGQSLINLTAQDRCNSLVCEDLYGDDTPLARQAAIVADRVHGTYAGYVEEADFLKLREVSVALSLPQRFARSFGAQGLTLTLAGRNLATWTDYSGFDPEVNFDGQDNFATADYYTLPPSRYFTARIDLNF